MTDDQIEALTETIIGCAIEVHKTLGPGLLESVYRECLVLELRGSRLGVEIEQRVPFDYKGQAFAASSSSTSWSRSASWSN